MTKDVYWDELGVAWQALGLDEEQTSTRLKARLHRQTMMVYAVLVLGIPLGFAGAALGLWTIWTGYATGAWFFVTRGIAITAISALLGFSSFSFQSAMRDNCNSLAVMIELALSRAERLRGAMRLGLLGCGIAAVFGTLGYAIRVHLGRPPAMSPIEPLLLLALLGVALFLVLKHAKADVGKYRYLRRALLK